MSQLEPNSPPQIPDPPSAQELESLLAWVRNTLIPSLQAEADAAREVKVRDPLRYALSLSL